MSKYRTRKTVDARQIGKDEEDVITGAGVIPGKPGQYVITDNGAVTVMSEEEFKDTYEPVTAKAKVPAKPVTKTAAKPPAKTAQTGAQKTAAERVAAKKAQKKTAK